MRKEKALVALLRDLVDLLADEAARNPEFGDRLERLLEAVPERRMTKPRKAVQKGAEPLPDVHAEWTARGETDFRLWLREQPIPIVRSVIRAQDLDPTRRTLKWKDPEKLAGFVADSLRARLLRGSAFTGTTATGRPDK
ncbi:MAG: hypothetical protein MUE84_08325 [Hyphomonas sp.]|jgi:hypothetical protein|nr:hypothetical protein [Hyphomonas sp.]